MTGPSVQRAGPALKKLVFIANQYYPNVVGGAELTLQTLAQELARKGFDVVVISLSPTNRDTQDEVEGIRVYRVAVRNLYAPFGAKQSAAKKLLWHIRDVHNPAMAASVGDILDLERPDTVATHNLGGFSVAVWAEARRRGLRIVHTLHDYYLLCPSITMFRDGRNCGRRCLACRALSFPKREASRLVDVVIGVSRFVLDAHLSQGFFPNARAAVIYNSRAASIKPVVPLKRPTGDTVLRIGFLGRVEKAKGIEVLLEAVSGLPPESFELLVGGKATSPAYLEELRNCYPLTQVHYEGFVSPDSFYPTIDVFVVPSVWNEPLGVVVYEAMGYGVPVIGSRAGGIPEMLEGSGAGWLFEPGNVIELRSLLRHAITSRPTLLAMRDACLTRRQSFLPDHQSEEFLRVIGWR